MGVRAVLNKSLDILDRLKNDPGYHGNRTKDGFKLDWRPEPAGNDLSLSAALPFQGTLLEEVDLRDKQSSVKNQGREGSCVGHAGCSVYEYYALHHQLSPHKEALDEFDEASERMLYFLARREQGWQEIDSGAFIRDAARVMATHGICRESSWPYRAGDYRAKPTPQALIEASRFKALGYVRLHSIRDMQASLTQGHPFMLGFTVFGSLDHHSVGITGQVLHPKPHEAPSGGHAVAAVGYNNDRMVDGRRGAFLVKNSWGPTYGDRGYLWLSYEYVERYADDFWRLVMPDTEEAIRFAQYRAAMLGQVIG